MSFDLDLPFKTIGKTVSIPFDQGNVFRLVSKKKVDRIVNMSQSLSNRAMSFDAFLLVKPSQLVHRLNPFRTGRCLSTIGEEQGIPVVITSQSLSNRAMSFDQNYCVSIQNT